MIATFTYQIISLSSNNFYVTHLCTNQFIFVESTNKNLKEDEEINIKE